MPIPPRPSSRSREYSPASAACRSSPSGVRALMRLLRESGPAVSPAGLSFVARSEHGGKAGRVSFQRGGGGGVFFPEVENSLPARPPHPRPAIAPEGG